MEHKAILDLDELPSDLPILTEVVSAPNKIEPQADTKLLVKALEQQIEGLLQQKLLVQFEQLQLAAITQAVNEIKAELPILISKALAEQRRD